MKYKDLIPRLEKATFDLKECTENEERNSVIQQLVSDLENSNG